jgi:type IX secretion system PorP/SprF family membrane protein
MKKNYLILFIFLLCSSITLLAQQDPHFSLYRFHANIFNPAVTGIKEVPVVSLGFRSQWQGFTGAPETQVVAFGTPTQGERIGLGFNVVNDKTFIENQTLIFGSFSYRLQMNDDLDLFLGLQAGTNAYAVNARGLEVYGLDNNTIDPFLLNVSNFNPNIGVGAYLKHEKYFFSLSAPKILKTQRFKEQNGLVTSAADWVHIYASAGYFIPLNKQWEFVPSTLVRYVNFAPFLITTNASFSYKRIIDFGIEYNFKSGIGATMMVETGNSFSFGYAYITSLHAQLNPFSKGTHEIAMRIRLGASKQRIAEKPNRELFGPISTNEGSRRSNSNEKKIGTKN